MRTCFPALLGSAFAWTVVCASAAAQVELDRDAILRQANVGRALGTALATTVRADLKLSEEQVKQLTDVSLAVQAASLVGTLDESLAVAEKLEREGLSKILTQTQAARLKQIGRQRQTLAMQLQDDEVAADLKLTARQREQIKGVAAENEQLSRNLSEMHTQMMTGSVNGARPAPERMSEMSRGFAAGRKAQQDEGDARLRAVLTAEQNEKLVSVNGKKIDVQSIAARPFSTYQTVRLGVKSGPDVGFFLEPEHQAHLGVTETQRAEIDRLPAERFVVDEASMPRSSYLSSVSLLSTSGRGALNDMPAETIFGLEEMTRIFTFDQIRRARELTLQKAVQKYGPTGIFEFKETMGAIALKPDQIVTLATTAYEQRREMPRLALARLQANLPNAPNAGGDQREEWLKRADQRLAEILSPEQLAVLAQLKGEPYSGELNVNSPQAIGTIATRGLADLIKFDFVLRQLGLTRGQAQRLNATAGTSSLSRHSDEEVLAVLTPEQQAKLISLYGKPLEPAKR